MLKAFTLAPMAKTVFPGKVAFNGKSLMKMDIRFVAYENYASFDITRNPVHRALEPCTRTFDAHRQTDGHKRIVNFSFFFNRTRVLLSQGQ
jgi:hypothetical protein